MDPALEETIRELIVYFWLVGGIAIMLARWLS